MHRLALRMGRTVAELSAVMTTDEFNRWAALDARLPLGDERMDAMFAHLCMVVAGLAGAKKLVLKDFLTFPKPEPEPSAAEAMRAWFGHRVIRGKRIR